MELVVVISALAILMILGISWVLGYYETARVTRIATDARVVEDAAHDYFVANSEWPIQGGGMSPESVAGGEDKVYTIDSLLEGRCVMSQDSASGFEYYSIDPSALKGRVKISTSWDMLLFCLNDQRVRIVYGEGSIAKSEVEIEVPDGYIPVASRSDLEAIGSGNPHKFAEGTEWEVGDEIVGGMSDNYAMVQDIELGSENFEPIGHGSGWGFTSFNGNFNGNGLKIYNGEINYPNDNRVGIFATTSTGALTNIVAEEINVIGNNRVGILAGHSGGSISDCYSTGNVEGNVSVGGLVGYSWSSIISCYSTSDVEGNMDVGGLVGTNENNITNSYSTGEVTGATTSSGGIVGGNSGILSNSYSTSDINGNEQVGGLAGSNSSVIFDCYSTGSVNGDVDVGGLVGYSWSYIANSYSIGYVVGNDNVGGLAGRNHPFATIENSYWDTEASGQENSDGGTNLVTSQMQGVVAESNMSGFDFNNIWLTVTNLDNYPILWWQNE